MAKVGRSMVAGSVSLVTTMRKTAIKATLRKYESIAINMVLVGSRFFEICAMKRWTEKKITTVTDASALPQSPGI